MIKRGEHVRKLSRAFAIWLRPFCRKVQIAGSIRRKEPNPRDIDIVLIPRDKTKLENFMRKKGKFVQGGEHESTWNVEGVKVELYYTVPDEWGAALLAYSARKGSAIGLRMVAKRKGFLLNNHGLFKNEKKVAGKTEKSIYDALKRPYKKPEDR